MQALVFDGTHLTLDPRRDTPTPPPGEVLIRPTRMGVCATDLELCKGYMGFKGVIGHEFVGVVEAAADAAGEKWVGKRVVGEINCPTEVCDLCKAGMKEHARKRTVLGILGRDGVFAERFTLPAANLHAVPDHVDDDRAVFVEPLAAAYQILRQMQIEASGGRPWVTVLGDGRLGLLCAQVLAAENATVRVIGKHEQKLRLCEKWGVKHRLLDDIGRRMDQDIVIDCTGSAGGLSVAMQMVRPRGTIVMKTTVAGDQWAKLGLDLSPIVIHEITLLGSRCGPFPAAIDAVSADRIDVLSLISRRFKLPDAIDAIAAANKPGALKVLIEP